MIQEREGERTKERKRDVLDGVGGREVGGWEMEGGWVEWKLYGRCWSCIKGMNMKVRWEEASINVRSE